MTGTVGQAARLDEHAAAREHYTAMAREAALPQVREELEAAVQLLRWGNDHDLILCHVMEALRLLGPPEKPDIWPSAAYYAPSVFGPTEDRNLVWERLPSGEFGWLEADRTIKDRSV